MVGFLLASSFLGGKGVGGKKLYTHTKTCQNADNIITMVFFGHDFLCLFLWILSLRTFTISSLESRLGTTNGQHKFWINRQKNQGR